MNRTMDFYHRHTGVNEFSRQAMMESIDVAMGKDGMLYIGNVKFLNGEPVSSKPVEMTSQGPHINGIDAYKWISAGDACHIYGGSHKAYIAVDYDRRDEMSTPIVNISSGTTAGFRYLQFGNNAPERVSVVLDRHKKVKVNVRIDSYRGRIAATLDFSENEFEKTAQLDFGIVGKHAVYFEFLLEEEGAVVEFDRFSFDM